MWSFSDWRFIFYKYEEILEPFTSNIESAKWLLFTFKEVQRGLYTGVENWTPQRKCATLVNILLHFIIAFEYFESC